MILLDAHAHLHTIFSRDVFLDGAWEHFRRLASPRSPDAWTGCLFVAGTASSPVRTMLAPATDEHSWPGRAARASPAAWSLERVEEAVLTARAPNGRELLLVPGVQLQTREGIEILVIGTPVPGGGRRPALVRTVADVREAGGILVLPWGFGKWTLGRKRFLLDCLEAWGPGDVVLADSAARPAAFPIHPVITRARQLGHPVLAGTDPLPFPAHERRAGSFAAKLEAPPGSERFWPRLRSRLTAADLHAELVGRRDGLGALLLQQVKLRLRRARTAG